jgi:acetyl esterase
MTLDRQTKAALGEYARAQRVPTHLLSPSEARRAYATTPDLAGAPEPVAKVWDDLIPGPDSMLPARFYLPEVSLPAPILVYFHGGGWVCGGIEYVDPPLRSIANRAKCGIVSVDYRLAPEHPFPAAPEDAYAATSWVAAHARALGFDPGRMAVGGDSAGGNLATGVALMARDRRGPLLKLQVLVYPATNHDFTTASYRDNATGYLLTADSMRWYWSHYLGEETRNGGHPYASPLRANAVGLPPALVVTAEYDPLRDEGEAYARHMQEAGVDVVLRRYDGLVHGFFRMAGAVGSARRALDDIAHALGRL